MKWSYENYAVILDNKDMPTENNDKKREFMKLCERNQPEPFLRL